MCVLPGAMWGVRCLGRRFASLVDGMRVGGWMKVGSKGRKKDCQVVASL